jgi:hypothetical protein
MLGLDIDCKTYFGMDMLSDLFAAMFSIGAQTSSYFPLSG